jgi:hypothetical protein
MSMMGYAITFRLREMRTKMARMHVFSCSAHAIEIPMVWSLAGNVTTETRNAAVAEEWDASFIME